MQSVLGFRFWVLGGVVLWDISAEMLVLFASLYVVCVALSLISERRERGVVVLQFKIKFRLFFPALKIS